MSATESAFDLPVPLRHDALMAPLGLRLHSDVELPIQLGRYARLVAFDSDVVDRANINTLSGLPVIGGHDVDTLRQRPVALVVAIVTEHGRSEHDARQDMYRALNAVRLATGCEIRAEFDFVVRCEGNSTQYAGGYRRDQSILGGERGRLIDHSDVDTSIRILARSLEVRERYAVEEREIRSRRGEYRPHVPLVRALQLYHVALRTFFAESRSLLLTAALEALVLAEGGFASADFRRRVPVLAGPLPEPVDPKRLAYLYNLRSSIAHGNVLPTGVSARRDPEPLQELEHLVERVLRRALLNDEIFDALGHALPRKRSRERVREFFTEHGDLSVDERVKVLLDRLDRDLDGLVSSRRYTVPDPDESEERDPSWSRDYEICGLRFIREPGGRTAMKIVNLERLQTRIGRQVLRDLLRCLLWADRLISMADLALLGKLRRADETASYATTRDVQTMFWFSCGCLKELSKALESLGSRDLTKTLTNDGRAAWAELTMRRKRWQKKVFSDLRNRAGFHVDPADFENGLDLLAQGDNGISLAQGIGPSVGNGWFPIAHAAVVRGVWPEDGRVTLDSKLLNQVTQDARGVGPLVERVLVGLMSTLR